jgi:predicted O-methyltransferase YrrM
MRYLQLLDAVRQKQPTAILEVGTWNGVRALEMLNLAPKARYYGFDLFEDATAETDRQEMNVKPHYYMEKVFERLEGFDAHLYKGNTRETLKTFNEKVDFVWLDGGHSIETIRSDWENVKRCLMPGAWVFFDDYYSDGIDTSRMGCNEIVKDLKHEVLPEKDWVKGGGRVQMVRVYG